MKEIYLEPWESVSEKVKPWLPLLEKGQYPKLTGEPETGKFYRIYPEGCICANMQPYHGSIKVGRESNRLVIYLNGGGVSWNEYTAARPSGLFHPEEGEWFYFNEAEWMGDGILGGTIACAREDNPFRDWSVINLPYATGDFHCGNGDFPYTALDGTERILPHHGYRNTMAVLEMAKKWIREPEKLLIAGSSAGGFGVALMAEDIISRYPGCADITCLIDSSILFKDDWAAVARNVWQAPEHIWRRLVTDNLTLDSYTALYQAFGKRVRCLFVSSVRDEALIGTQNALDGKGMVQDAECADRIQREMKKMYRQMMEQMPGSACYFFDKPAGIPGMEQLKLTKHCVMDGESFFDMPVEGRTFCEWLWNAVNGTTEQIGLGLL